MELHRFFRYAIEKMCKEKKSLNHFIDKNLGNGFYMANYYRHGTFNTKGNILTLDQVSFPIVNKENAPKDLFSRTAIDENLKKNIFACNFKPIEK